MIMIAHVKQILFGPHVFINEATLVCSSVCQIRLGENAIFSICIVYILYIYTVYE